MDIEILKDLIEKGYSQREIAKLANKSQASIKHWLKKYDLKTKHISHDVTSDRSEKKCPKCKVIKPLNNFYKRKRVSSYCKRCIADSVLERQRIFKIKCIEYKGGHCEKCNYNKCMGALEFHHLEKNTKEFEISKFRLNTFNDIVKNELDKCMLLCANCHREIHSSV